MSESLQSGEAPESSEVEPTHADGSQESSETKAASEGPRKHRVKVDGKELEVSDDDLIRDYQLKEASYKRMEEASKLSKSLQPYLPVIEALQKGDLGVLKKLGVPKEALRKFSEQELIEYLEEQELSPEERRAREAERERDKIKAERDEERRKADSQRQEQLAHKAAQDIESEIVDALKEIEVPLKGNYRLVRRMAEDMFASLEAKQPKVTAKQARERVLKGMREDFEEYVKRGVSGDLEKFIESLPAELVDGVRKRDLKRVSSQLPMGGASSEIKKTPRKDDDFRSYMRDELQKRG